MKTSRFFTVLGLALTGLFLTGCAYTSEISKTRKVIEAETEADLDKGIVVSFGPGLFQTAGWLTRFADDADAQYAGRVVSGIRRIKAGVYPVAAPFDIDQVDIPALNHFKRKGWKAALKVVDYDEVSWLLYRERRGRVHDLFVVSLSENELVLARLQGNLDELLNFALIEVEKDGFASFDTDPYLHP